MTNKKHLKVHLCINLSETACLNTCFFFVILSCTVTTKINNCDDFRQLLHVFAAGAMMQLIGESLRQGRRKSRGVKTISLSTFHSGQVEN